MSAAFLCRVCLQDAEWIIERRGDAAVRWACTDDLGRALLDFGRRGEVTQFSVRPSAYGVAFQIEEILEEQP